ncbi:glycoside hydrolase family 44 protein [Pirellulimonas nuda]|uniref:glycoside hydrolase family 44 protein n=1 Tax=Pirellulimonas nuda TaxID=2528009 RepID=UPI0011AB06D8|nr:glycoside hydrolase family 44 protein [Pirellulimonas nuda]
MLVVLSIEVPTTRAITPDKPGGGSVQFAIDSGLNVAPISPWIYGTNFNSVPGATLNRIGGNRLTGYNWENNASNAGADWYHHNDYGMASGPNDPPGSAFRGSIQSGAVSGQAVLVTVPMAGYVAADGIGTVDETEIAPSNRWKEVVPKKSTIYPGSSLSTSPNHLDGYVFTDELAHWVEGFKTPNQAVFYSLDNEVGLWGEDLQDGWQSGSQPRPWENPPVPAVQPTSGGRTHPTIHPFNPSFAELRNKTIAHAGAIKDVNPNAIVFGGVGYGWTDFTNLSSAPDAVTSPAHPGGDQPGEMHYYEWLLKEVHDAEVAQGRKLMDVLDLHWYTEVYADGQRITSDMATPAAIEARVQATRSLWDPTYAEESWISQWGTWQGSPGNNGPIQLLPRVQRDIDDFKPGTKIAITEYNYGGTNHISGAIAQADALGVFGREGVFAANLWGEGSYVEGAFDMYLNYDGAGGAFGSTSIEAGTSSIASSAVYASVDEDDPNRMFVIAINRTGSAITTGVAVTHDRVFDHAEVYQLTNAGAVPQRMADVELDLLNAFQYTMPAYSVTTLVLVSDGLLGDFNRDGTVDGADYTVWRDSLGLTGNLAADANEDNIVDIDDYNLWRSNFSLTTSSTGLPTVSTPEPSGVTLALAASLCGAAIQRWRSR